MPRFGGMGGAFGHMGGGGAVPVSGVASVGPATVAFLANVEDATDQAGGSYTFSAVSLGTASAGRYIVVGVSGYAAASQTITSSTINGVSATQVATVVNTTNTRTSFLIANVPTGTSGDIVINFNGSMAACAIGVWALTSLVSSTPTATASHIDVDPLTNNLDISASGVAIGYANGGAVASWAWTNLTEEVGFDLLFEGSTRSHTGASAAFASAQSALAITANPNASPRNLLLAAWR